MKQAPVSNRRLPWQPMVIIAIAIFAWANLLCGAESGGFTVVDNFEQYGDGKFPNRWQGQRGERELFIV